MFPHDVEYHHIKMGSLPSQRLPLDVLGYGVRAHAKRGEGDQTPRRGSG